MEGQYMPPPPPGSASVSRKEGGRTNSTTSKGWQEVEANDGSTIPCQRSLHAGAVWKDCFVVFGGYDGHRRVNDLYSFNFTHNQWQMLNGLNAPTPRDRHVANVFDDCLYIFGGFDGTMRVNDLHAYNLEANEWSPVEVLGGVAPSPRHSHASVVYHQSMYVFGGYDGSYRSDLHEFNFYTRRWTQVQYSGDVPRARYRGTCVVNEDSMILHGGHDGNRHLQDTHVFDFVSCTWSTLATEGPIPSPRDSHVSVIYGNSMYLYGGSTGSAMGDFHELKLGFRRVWSPVESSSSGYYGGTAGGAGQQGGAARGASGGMRPYPSYRSGGPGAAGSGVVAGSPGTAMSMSPQRSIHSSGYSALSTPSRATHGSAGDHGNAHNSESEEVGPGVRFCHVGVVYEGAFYIFGGYDGLQRLNDFLRYRFDQDETDMPSPPSTLITDLRNYVNNEVLSDIQFIVEGIPVHAHKILCLRCPYFKNMLTGEYMESRAREVVVHDVKYATFLLVMHYLYTDEVHIQIDNAMDLFQVADRFGLDRLKQLCELEMQNAISIDTAAHILYTADQHNAENLRERCLGFILVHFDEISRTAGFEEMGRTNVELVFEILRRR